MISACSDSPICNVRQAGEGSSWAVPADDGQFIRKSIIMTAIVCLSYSCPEKKTVCRKSAPSRFGWLTLLDWLLGHKIYFNHVFNQAFNLVQSWLSPLAKQCMFVLFRQYKLYRPPMQRSVMNLNCAYLCPLRQKYRPTVPSKVYTRMTVYERCVYLSALVMVWSTRPRQLHFKWCKDSEKRMCALGDLREEKTSRLKGEEQVEGATVGTRHSVEWDNAN